MKTYQDKNIIQNHKLSKLNEFELYALLKYILSYNITMKDKLNIKSNNTFGIEIEFDLIKEMQQLLEKLKDENIKYVDILSPYFYLNDNINNWIYTDEFTLINGLEINSPILHNTKNEWNKIKDICYILNNHAQISNHCAGHIHIGSQILGNNPEAWLNFLKLWSVYENIIYRFSYGEYSVPRKLCKTFAKPVAKESMELYNDLKKSKDVEEIVKSVNNKFYKYDKGFNLENVKTNNINDILNKNTIEIRCPNGTLNPIIWQNNVYFFIKLLEYCNSTKFNDDVIEKRLRKVDINNYDLDYYDNIYINQALELSDMIYSDDDDKLSFLKQYIKNFKKTKKPNYKAYK